MVYTTQRSSYSPVAYAILAQVPSKPTDIPASDSSITNQFRVKVTYSVGTTGVSAPVDNGSPIVSYDIQVDDGEGGEFYSLQGFS